MDVTQLRREVERLGPAVRGRRLPAELKRRLVAAARELREQGLGWLAVGEALGVSGESARRWCDETEGGTAMVPVQRVHDDLGDEGFDGLALVTPGGYRLEGLTMEEAAALLRAMP